MRGVHSGLRQPPPPKGRGFARISIPQHKDAPARHVPAQADSLLQGGDGEVAHAAAVQGLRHAHIPVPVRVGLDHRHDPDALRRQARERPRVVPESRQVHFRPGAACKGAACKGAAR